MPSPVKRDPKVPHSISFPPFQGSLTYVRRGLELLVSSDDTRGETHTGFRVQMGELASASLVSALLVHTPYTPYSSRGIRGKGSMISQDFGCYVDARCQMLDARSQMLDARREMRDTRRREAWPGGMMGGRQSQIDPLRRTPFVSRGLSGESLSKSQLLQSASEGGEVTIVRHTGSIGVSLCCAVCLQPGQLVS